LFEVLKDILHSNTANIGEAAGYGIGMKIFLIYKFFNFNLDLIFKKKK